MHYHKVQHVLVALHTCFSFTSIFLLRLWHSFKTVTINMPPLLAAPSILRLNINAPTLASCSFNKHRLILITFWSASSAHFQKWRACSTFLVPSLLLTLVLNSIDANDVKHDMFSAVDRWRLCNSQLCRLWRHFSVAYNQSDVLSLSPLTHSLVDDVLWYIFRNNNNKLKSKSEQSVTDAGCQRYTQTAQHCEGDNGVSGYDNNLNELHHQQMCHSLKT